MPKITKGELKSNIERCYFHHAYIAKLSCVDIIQFFERFTRFNLYPRIEIVGVTGQREWERLVRNYLEEVHSFIDLQRRVVSAASEFSGTDLKEIARSIYLPLPVDSIIINELRRQIHHESVHIIYVAEMFGSSFGMIPAIPHIRIEKDWFTDEGVKARLKELQEKPEHLSLIFGTHCEHFISSSNAIGNSLLERFGFPRIAPRSP